MNKADLKIIFAICAILMTPSLFLTNNQEIKSWIISLAISFSSVSHLFDPHVENRIRRLRRLARLSR